MLRNCDRERRIEKYFNTRPHAPVDVEKMTILMMRLTQREFDHVMKIRVGLDKSHLLCYCSGDKPHRLKDCSKVPGGSKCHHLITKGKNKGGFKKKSSCPTCCPNNFCPHQCRRDNCQKCKLKGKGQSSRFKGPDNCQKCKLKGKGQSSRFKGPDTDKFLEGSMVKVEDKEDHDIKDVEDFPFADDVQDFPLVDLQDVHDDVAEVPFLVEGSHY
jgi:hypothetical protein